MIRLAGVFQEFGYSLMRIYKSEEESSLQTFGIFSDNNKLPLYFLEGVEYDSYIPRKRQHPCAIKNASEEILFRLYENDDNRLRILLRLHEKGFKMACPECGGKIKFEEVRNTDINFSLDINAKKIDLISDIQGYSKITCLEHKEHKFPKEMSHLILKYIKQTNNNLR